MRHSSHQGTGPILFYILKSCYLHSTSYFILLTEHHLVFASSAVNLTTWSLLREPTLWLLLAVVEVEEGLDRISADPTISSASANRTPPVLQVCMWMTLWQQSLKTLQPLSDFCPLNGPQRAPPNPPPEDCSLATEAEPPSTARLAFSLHHSLKVFFYLVCTHTHIYTHTHRHTHTHTHNYIGKMTRCVFKYTVKKLE